MQAIIACGEGKDIRRSIHTYKMNKGNMDIRDLLHFVSVNFSPNDITANDWLIIEKDQISKDWG